MFIGHYAPAAALKPLTPAVPLWHYFVAVQFLDYLWAAFILAGVEKARITPGFLEGSDLDLYFMPYTHSLAGAAFWSIIAFAAYRYLINARAGTGGAILIGAAVFSHWLADLIVHAKDLALFPGSDVKLGFGLWSSLIVSKGLEIGFFLGGFILYLGGTSAKGTIGKMAPYFVMALLIGIEIYAATRPPPISITNFAIVALVIYTVYAALGAWLDATRSGRQR